MVADLPCQVVGLVSFFALRAKNDTKHNSNYGDSQRTHKKTPRRGVFLCQGKDQSVT